MRKSELYARYHHFNEDIEEISPVEYFFQLKNYMDRGIAPGGHSDQVDGSTYWSAIHTDGMDYMAFNSSWNVGWQGDIDSDQYFCKRKTLSKKEREEIQALFVV